MQSSTESQKLPPDQQLTLSDDDLADLKELYQAEESRLMVNVELQAAWICRIFPQYKLDEIEEMGVAEFDKLYTLSQVVRHQLQMDNVMAVATICSKKAVSEIKKTFNNDKRALEALQVNLHP